MKTLIVAPAWVGDMVMAHTLVQRLVAWPDTGEIHMAAPPATAPLAQRMPGVSKTHVVEFAHGELGIGKRRRVGRQLRHENYQQAFVLPNSWKSALLPWFAGIKRRTGWHGEARYVLLNDRRRLERERYPLMIERFMALADPGGALPLQPYPLPQLEPDAENLSRLLHELGLRGEGVTVLCPGAEFGAAKKWPAHHYADIAGRVMGSGRQVWLMGSPKDAEDCAEIAAAAPGVTDLSGRTTLLDAVDLISVAEQVVCNDSGLMHVACALGRPTVGIFGSTSPQFTPPLGEKAAVVQLELECRPCFKRTCPLGHLQCLEGLQPERVADQMLVRAD